jgi:hypothetical protein
VNSNRIKEIGRDCAAAEWLVRNGSTVKWADNERFQSEFSQLPQTNHGLYKLVEIDAKNSSIMDIGFQHLGSDFEA